MARRIITTVADKWTLVSLSLLIIGLPFSRAVVEVSISALILGWIIYRLSSKPGRQIDSGLKAKGIFKKFWVECGIGIPLAAFVSICLLSLVTTNHLYPESLRGIIRVIKYTLLCLAVMDSVNKQRRFNNLLILTLTIAVIISLNGLVQYFLGTDLIRHYPLYESRRISSSFGNPNDFSGYLCLLIPIPVCLTFFYQTKRSTKQVLLSLVVCILSIAMILTYSKGAWVGLAVALLLVFLFQIKNKKRGFLFLSGIVICLIILFMFTQNRFGFWSAVEKSMVVRLNIWHTAINMIQAQPVVGNGINTFHAEYPFYRVDNGSGSGYAHNCYLQMAAEIGLVGLCVFVWIIVSLFGLGLKGLKSMKNSEDGFHQIVLLGLLAGIFAFLIHCMVDTNLYSLPLATLFWLSVGVTISLLKINKVIR